MGRTVARHHTVHRAVLTAALLAIATGAAAQPLADAARRAEEQRKASAVEPLVLKPPPPRAEGPVRLTHELVRHYLDARFALADVRRADRQLDFRLKKAMSARVMRYYANFLPILEAEPAIAETLAGFGFTPASYLFIEEALMRGKSLATAPRGTTVLFNGAHAENIRFVLENRAFVDATLNSGLQAEHKLQSCCVVLIPE